MSPSRKGLLGESLCCLGSAGETSGRTVSVWLWVFFILPPLGLLTPSSQLQILGRSIQGNQPSPASVPWVPEELGTQS